MSYPRLKPGDPIIINNGYYEIEAVVARATKTLVSPVGHKDFLRRDCYAVPGEMDRLISDVQAYAARMVRVAENHARSL